MNEITGKLAQWAVEKIKREYPQDVALLVSVEGHEVNGDGHGLCFDYFVPATGRGHQLSQTFIIDGIGYDLYPRTWERMEQTAALNDPATFCLGSAVIRYSRSDEDAARFESIRRTLHRNLADPEFVYRKALELLDIAMDLYRTMMFEDAPHKVRTAAGYIHHYLSQAVFTLNNTYEGDQSNGRESTLLLLPRLPEHFIETYQAICRAKRMGELKQLAHEAIASTRIFIAPFRPHAEEPPQKKDFQELADWYQEVSLWWRRLRYYCDTGRVDPAFKEACGLQSELSIVGGEFGLGEMDLLGGYDWEDLPGLARRANELERHVVSEIEKHGVRLKQYGCVEQFLDENR